MKNNFLILKKVSKIDFLDFESIDMELRENEVSLTKLRKVKQFNQHLRNILNERFIREQLNLINQTIDFRDLWYQVVDYRMKGKPDISMKNPYIATQKAVKEYCLKLMDFYSVNHWSMVMDKLNLEAKGKAIIYDVDMKGIVLTIESIKDFEKVPFAIILCEKETILKQTLRALKDLGYNHGIYGINTGGVGTSAVARLLLKYQESIPNKFYMFSLTDFDLAGLKIFFDFRKYFTVERAGLNSEMIDFLNLDFSLLTSEYTSQVSLDKQKQECLNMLERLNLTFFENVYYLQEIDKCSQNKIELNSLSAYRSETDKLINPCIDYAEYIASMLEKGKRIYDLNRFDSPRNLSTNSTSRIKSYFPKFITKAKESINKMIFDKIDSYSFWYNQIERTVKSFDKFNSSNERKKDKILLKGYNEIIVDNYNYSDSLTEVVETIDSQNAVLKVRKQLKDKLINKNVRFERAILKQMIKDLDDYSEKKEQIEQILESITEIFK